MKFKGYIHIKIINQMSSHVSVLFTVRDASLCAFMNYTEVFRFRHLNFVTKS